MSKRKQMIKKICKVCGESFEIHSYRRHTALYCSRKCLYNRNGIKKSIICLSCGKIFRVHHYRKDISKFCSKSCQGKSHYERFKDRFMYDRHGKNHPFYGKKLSEEHRRKISENHADMSGERSPTWKGGITSINERIRKSKEYVMWRIAVFERDNYICRACGKKGCYLHADHIKPFAFYPNLRFDINNGRSLCKNCHCQTDTYGGRIKQT